jgi:hypothetical protein
MPSRRTATGAGRRTRAVSCMRSLDQTRQLRPEMLRWCKGRPSARRPQCPAANPCDWSDSDLFALEGDPHQRCLAMTVHPAERKGWVIDDQRTTTGANHESPLASGGATPRRPLPPTSARKCHATCEQRRLRHNGRRRQQQTRTPHHDQRRAASGLREPNSNSVTRLSRTQRDLRLCLTDRASAAPASADRPRRSREVKCRKATRPGTPSWLVSAASHCWAASHLLSELAVQRRLRVGLDQGIADLPRNSALRASMRLRPPAGSKAPTRSSMHTVVGACSRRVEMSNAATARQAPPSDRPSR